MNFVGNCIKFVFKCVSVGMKSVCLVDLLTISIFYFILETGLMSLVTWRCWSSVSLNRREAAVLMYFTRRDWLSSLRSHVRIFKVGEDEVSIKSSNLWKKNRTFTKHGWHGQTSTSEPHANLLLHHTSPCSGCKPWQSQKYYNILL